MGFAPKVCWLYKSTKSFERGGKRGIVK